MDHDGAGMGGLALAQALAQALACGGTEVVVHERDRAVEATGGYRLDLDHRACAALRRHLAPSHCHALPAPDGAYPGRPGRLDAAALVGLIGALLRGWSEDVRALVDAADPASVAFFGFHAADPDADFTPWPADAVTALGDAVHAMPPTGGMAAATAIRDADLLAEELALVRDGMSTIPLAVHRYQRRMAAYAGEAVRTSLQPLRWIERLATPAGTRVARVALLALATAARLRRSFKTAFRAWRTAS